MLVYQKVYHIEPWFSVPAGYEFHESSSLINDVTILIKHGFWNNPPHIWVGPFVHYPTINFRKIKGGFLVFLKTRRQLQQDQPLNVGNKQEKTSQNHSRLPGEYLLKFSRFFLFGFGMLLGTPHHDTSSCGWCLETYRDIYRYFFFRKNHSPLKILPYEPKGKDRLSTIILQKRLPLNFGGVLFCWYPWFGKIWNDSKHQEILRFFSLVKQFDKFFPVVGMEVAIVAK